MALLGFSKFKEKIEDGTKRRTIRRIRKHPKTGEPNPIRVGEKLYLYWHLRRPDCQRLRAKEDDRCKKTLFISISIYENWLNTGKKICRIDLYTQFDKLYCCQLTEHEVEELYTADGFSSLEEFCNFFGTTFPSHLTPRFLSS